MSEDGHDEEARDSLVASSAVALHDLQATAGELRVYSGRVKSPELAGLLREVDRGTGPRMGGRIAPAADLRAVVSDLERYSSKFPSRELTGLLRECAAAARVAPERAAAAHPRARVLKGTPRTMDENTMRRLSRPSPHRQRVLSSAWSASAPRQYRPMGEEAMNRLYNKPVQEKQSAISERAKAKLAGAGPDAAARRAARSPRRSSYEAMNRLYERGKHVRRERNTKAAFIEWAEDSGLYRGVILQLQQHGYDDLQKLKDTAAAELGKLIAQDFALPLNSQLALCKAVPHPLRETRGPIRRANWDLTYDL
jgi:hypothetical protein